MDPNQQPPVGHEQQQQQQAQLQSESEPTLPPAEQMRQKRLAMLNRSSASNSASALQPASEAPARNNTQTNTPNLSRPLDDENDPPKKPKLSPTEVRPTASATSTTSAPPAKLRTGMGKEKSIEDWTDRVLGDVFRVTLDMSRREAGITYLPSLAEDLRESGEPVKLAATNIDSAMVEAAALFPADKPLLDYLLPCWKRIVRAASSSRHLTPEQGNILTEAKRLCMSNCMFALTIPNLFGREPQPAHDTLVPYLLRGQQAELGICLDFLDEAVSRLKHDDDQVYAPVFTEALVQISRQLATMTMNQGYRPYMDCLVTYSRYPALLEGLVRHEQFLFKPAPHMTKKDLAQACETETILGPFFRISPLQAEVAKIYFSNARNLDAGQIRSSQTSLQMMLATHQSDLTRVVKALVRTSDKAREATLDWLAYSINTNHKRRAMRVDPREVASDGFMVNMTAVLDQLCQPFLDSTFSKISKIDVNYLRRSPRVDVSDETKLNADQAKADAFYGQKVGGSSSFISEVFFLTLAAHHYGTGAARSRMTGLDADIKYLERMERDVSEAVRQLESKPSQQVRLEAARRQYENVVGALNKVLTLKFSVSGVFMDESMLALSLQFMRCVAVWLLRVASRSDYVPGKKLILPLPTSQPLEFSCLPEYALQDVVANFEHILHHMPRLYSAVGEELVVLCVTFLTSSEYIKNVYLKAKLVHLLHGGVMEQRHMKHGVLGGLLMSSEFANKHLLHALMKFYIECEIGDVSADFYSRFNIRWEIFQIIKFIWPNGVYKEQLSKESRDNQDFFVQFVNLLLNDATYCLDEALTKLPMIHEYQRQLRDPAFTPEARSRILADLEKAESTCKNWMSYVNDTVAMMKLFTATLAGAFIMPAIVGRLAGMLDYNLDTLVGPKRGQLRVEDAQKYNFDPRGLLSDFVDIYLNLGSQTAFINAVAADGRSYKPANFDEASRILGMKALKSKEELARWAEIKMRIAEAKEILDQAELDLGEVPADFEDPIMGTLMTDPVRLPSGNVIDRSTIVQHLLSDNRDPFNRNPLTKEQIVPDDELRARVNAWKAGRISEAKAKKASSENVADVMDTTAG